MSQHDYAIDNQTFPSFRTDLNNLALAILGLNSGTSAPSTTMSHMLWADTTNSLLKQRNSANSAWLTLWAFGKQGLVDQSGASIYAGNASGINTLTMSLSPAPTAYTDGMPVRFRAVNNNTGAVTINVNSIGPVALKKRSTVYPYYVSDLQANDIVAYQIIEAIYDSTMACFQIQSPAYSYPIFTKSYESSPQTITAAGSLTLAHPLGTTPKLYEAYLKCTTAENGYSIGDETGAFFFCDGSSVNRGLTIVPDASNLNIRIGSQATSSLAVIRKDTGARATVTNANWNLIFRAWA